MRTEILLNIDNPHQLERLYRQNKSGFKHEFGSLYPGLGANKIADFWKERLNYESDDINWGTKKQIGYVIIGGLIAGILARIPGYFNIDEEFYYPRNIGFIVLPILTLYFAWKNRLSNINLVIIGAFTLVSLLFINFLPKQNVSDSLILACIHLPLLLWSVLAYSFVGGDLKDYSKRLEFLRYNGDLAVMSALILIAGGIVTGLTIGLFSLIGLNIEKFYFENIVFFGLAAVPIVATYLTETNPQIVNKVSPMIAKIFSPVVLVTLVAYLVAIVVSKKDIYNDREFLMVFNGLLLGVMAIILFSVAGTSVSPGNRLETFVLLLLSIVTVIVNAFALSAILFRISTLGITPNRVAVTVGNILILINLLLVALKLLKASRSGGDRREVGLAFASYLPVYAAWALIVTFLFPLIFGFK